MKSRQQKIEEAKARLLRSRDLLICRGSGREGYKGCIREDIKLVLDELEYLSALAEEAAHSTREA